MTIAKDNSIGKRLKQWRQSLGKKQIEFAEISGLGIAIIRKCEADASMPGGHTLIALAGTGLNVHWLLTGEGEMAITGRANIRPYIHRLHTLGEEMTPLQDKVCDDILTEMSIKVQNSLHIQRIDRALEILRKKTGKQP